MRNSLEANVTERGWSRSEGRSSSSLIPRLLLALAVAAVFVAAAPAWQRAGPLGAIAKKLVTSTGQPGTG
jgi:hypothetical protein